MDACIQSFNAICNAKWFRCMLGQARECNVVSEMLIYRVWLVDWFFISWGDEWIIIQILPWLCFKRDYIATIWGIIAVVLGKQSKTTADEIGRVFADLLPIKWEHYPSQKWDCGGRSGNANWYLMKWDIAFARIGWDNNILQFGAYCMSRSGPLIKILSLLVGSNPSIVWRRARYAIRWMT